MKSNGRKRGPAVNNGGYEILKTGINGLDELLNGGIPAGRAILVSGVSGTGKTTFAMQFLYHNALKGEPGLFITLEESKEKMVQDLKGVGMDLDKAPKLKIVGGPVADMISMTQRSGAGLKDFLREIRDMVEETGSKRVVIDSINLFLMLFKTDEERRNALISLSNLLCQMGCTSLLTCEARENTFDLSWYGFEEFVVDGVIALYSMKRESSFFQGVTVRKMRGVNHQKNIALYKITPNGIIVYPDQPLII
jgi:KaiC/GvpD/RAD55 family RecA-like ATPase